MENKNPQAHTGLDKLSANIESVITMQGSLNEAVRALQEKTAKLESGDCSSILKAELESLKAEVTSMTKKINFPAMPSVEIAEDKRVAIKKFFTDVKQAYYGNKKAALQGGTAPGSYLVPTEFLAVLWDLLPQYPAFINETFLLPWGIAGNTRQIPNLLQRPAFAYVGEGAAKPVSNPNVGTITQTLIKAAAICVLTEELLEDSAIDIERMLADIIGPALIDFYNGWLFQGLSGPTPAKTGIINASGILTPTVGGTNELAALKFAVAPQFRTPGKFFMENSVYLSILGGPKNAAPLGYFYEDGVMRIDGNAVIPMDASLIGAGNVVFGDLKNVIWSPKYELNTKFSDVATVVDGDTTHLLFQENKRAYLFETRGDITVNGSVFAKANITPTP